jgi:hypothetical protein
MTALFGGLPPLPEQPRGDSFRFAEFHRLIYNMQSPILPMLCFPAHYGIVGDFGVTSLLSYTELEAGDTARKHLKPL